jgi:hypothetical protein
MINTDKYEEYQNARVEGFIPAEWEFEDYLLAKVERLRSGMQDILDDFETTKTDMWSIIKRIQELIE